jgi:putative FmdB family regulatory protein
MPTYEYRCTKGHTFEVIQSMNDEPLTTCQVCGSPVERVLHSPAVHFKGSGFYHTDYGTQKRGKPIEPTESSSGSSSDSKSSGEDKPSKPAADAKPVSAKPKPAAGSD